MASIRVHELAKDMNISSKELLLKLQELGLNMKNHMSTIPSGEVNRIKAMVLNLDKPKNIPEPKEQLASKPKKGQDSQLKGSKEQKKQTVSPKQKPQEVLQDDNNLLINKIEKVVGEKAYERGGKQKTQKSGRHEERKTDFRKNNKANKNRKRKIPQKEQVPVVIKQITLEGPLTVQEFAHLLNKKAAEVIKKLMLMGSLVTINQELDVDTLVLLGSEFGTSVELKVTKEEMFFADEKEDKPEDLQERPPMVTIMVHF
jgi:translation initiation factor IF-2